MNGKDFDYALEERWVRDESLMKRVPEVIAQLLLDAASARTRSSTLRYLLRHRPPRASRRLAAWPGRGGMHRCWPNAAMRAPPCPCCC